MAKRNVKKFNVGELDDVLTALVADRYELLKRIHAATDTGSADLRNPAVDFDVAIAIRGMAQLLVTTCLTIQNIPVTKKLAELSGEPQAVPNLDNCGLDKLADDSDDDER